jgi:hypothetical protein
MVLNVFAQKKGQVKPYTDKQLLELHHGYLFFQLFDREITKEAIRTNLGQKAVDEYTKELEQKHLNLMNAFDTIYSFSKVLFFHSSDKENLKDRKFNAVKFYSTKNVLVPSDSINFSNYFIGEVSRIELDSVETVDGNDNQIKIPAYSFSALVLRDKNFVQLQKPFPYFVRTMQGVPILQKKSNKLVQALQNKLQRRYNKIYIEPAPKQSTDQ